ncbi:MAG TPA: hypothetical protein PJ986_05555 [Gammaproteobacteria bacterium]|nr:hypothetical protein [Gammaproteobacteria bacterium]
MSQTATTVVRRHTVEDLMYEMSREQVLALFRTLPAPGPQELKGEYKGHVHDGGDLALRAKRNAFFFDEASIFGSWMGKSYTSEASGHGEGYNIWRRTTRSICRNSRFRTEIAASMYDGRPSLMMYYAAYRTVFGEMDLIDEIRCLSDGLYLGVYSCTRALDGFSTLQPGNARSDIDVFALTGPTGPWVGVDDPKLEAI